MALIQKTVYIRPEDVEAWEAVPNKAGFIHNALQLKEAYLDLEPVQRTQFKNKVADILQPALRINPPSDNIPQISPSKDRESQGLCKIHGVPLDSRGKCLQKGCKYGK